MQASVLGPRVWTIEFNVVPANGVTFFDGDFTVNVTGAALDLQGNPFAPSPIVVTVISSAPALSNVAVTDADNAYRQGETVSLTATVTQNLASTGLALTADLSTIDASFGSAVPLVGPVGGVYTLTTPALTATMVEGAQRPITVTATNSVGLTSTQTVFVSIDRTAPTTVLTYGQSVQGTTFPITITFSEVIATVPTISITGITGTADIVGQALTGGPAASFTFNMTLDPGSTGTGTVAIGNAIDAAGNQATPALNLTFPVLAAPIPLVANAGPDQVLATVQQVTLSGAASTGFQITSYVWSQLSGPTVTLVQSPTLTSDVTFLGTLTVPNLLPTADAGADIYFDHNDVTTDATGTYTPFGLQGSASDGNGDPLSVQWVLLDGPTTPDAGNISMESTNSLSTRLKVTGASMVGGVYRFELRVTDPLTSSVNAITDIVRVVVVSPVAIAPNAHAGLDQSKSVGQTVTLTANESSHAIPNTSGSNHANLTFNWSLVVRPPLSAAALSDPTALSPTFIADVAGTYVAALTVTNTQNLLSNTDSVTINVVEPQHPTSLRSLTVRVNGQVVQKNPFGAFIVPLDNVSVEDGFWSSSGASYPNIVFDWTYRVVNGNGAVLFHSPQSASTSLKLAPGTYVISSKPTDDAGGRHDHGTADAMLIVTPPGVQAHTVSIAIDPADDADNDKNILFIPTLANLGVGGDTSNQFIDLSATVGNNPSGVKSYRWTQVAGPTVGLIGSNSASVRFQPILSRTYEFVCNVTSNDDVTVGARLALTVSTYDPVLNPTGNAVPAISAVFVAGVETPVTAGSTTAVAASQGNPFFELIIRDANTTSLPIVTAVQTSGQLIVGVVTTQVTRTTINGVTASRVRIILPPSTPLGNYGFDIFVDDGADIGLPIAIELEVKPRSGGGGGLCSLETGGTTGGIGLLLAIIGLVAYLRLRRRRAQNAA
jgi:hypothetical protein